MGLALLFFVGGFLAAVIFLLGIVHDARFPSRATMGWALGRGIPVDPSAMGLQSTEVKWRSSQFAWRVNGGNDDGDDAIRIPAIETPCELTASPFHFGGLQSHR